MQPINFIILYKNKVVVHMPHLLPYKEYRNAPYEEQFFVVLHSASFMAGHFNVT